MDMIWILIGFFSFVTILFVAFAVFFPEWVGITGAKAMDINRQHQEEPSEKDNSSK